MASSASFPSPSVCERTRKVFTACVSLSSMRLEYAFLLEPSGALSSPSRRTHRGSK
eukprot:CAMPEP_0181509236 /NCGR_PEP_ID=MMETSP1110-20121109/60230_1 /TAXON_ID=174948 /ORGANISM="Symbiodinium sp., Strain CCMP421" /LENGTH=55 /DNA_ID=CAMNT_0023638767 /DNA_START=30 /DNA_END=194 /DNA_ORIENTATION=-